MRNSISALLIAAALGVSGAANAVTTTTNFQVTATVAKTCSATSTPLAFGSYTPGAGALTGSTSVSVKCTKNTGFTVSLNAGTTANGGTIGQRLMGDGSGDTLEYNLYTTSGGSTIFGDGTSGSSTQSGTGAGVGTAVAVNVYGKLPESTNNQNAVPGNYSDTITATITY